MTAPKRRLAMAQRWRRIRTVPGLGRDVLLVLGLAVIGLAAVGYLLSQVNFTLPWTKREVLHAELSDAVAVRPTAQQEVRIAGVKVGLITNNAPTNHNTTIITMEIEPGHKIYNNARLVYRPVNPLNQMYVTINPGGPPAELATDNYTFPLGQTIRPIQSDEVLDKLDDKSRAALTSLLEESDNALANAPQSLPPGLRGADASLITLRPVVQRLEKRHENIQRLITGFTELNAALGRNDARLTSLADSTDATLGTLAARNDELGRTLQELPGTTDELKRSFAATTSLSHQLNPTLDDIKAASNDLPDALEQFQDALGPLHRTVAAARDVVRKGQPFVRNLNDSVGDLHSSFDDLAPLTACLDEYTKKIAPWMYDLGAFIYNTHSAWGNRDANGAFPQGQFTVDPFNPMGTIRKGSEHTNRYQDAPSVTTGLPYPAKGSGECR
jgi:phospholipid/cholesterol/gamma-HCH transport system substrate-binding protein